MQANRHPLHDIGQGGRGFHRYRHLGLREGPNTHPSPYPGSQRASNRRFQVDMCLLHQNMSHCHRLNLHQNLYSHRHHDRTISLNSNSLHPCSRQKYLPLCHYHHPNPLLRLSNHRHHNPKLGMKSNLRYQICKSRNRSIPRHCPNHRLHTCHSSHLGRNQCQV